MIVSRRSLWVVSVLVASATVGVPPCSTDPATVPAQSPRALAQPSQDSLQRHWEETKRLMATQAYREALQELAIILTLAPHDPVAVAYRKLCEKRLSLTREFGSLSPEQLASLEAALAQEQQAQAREAAQLKTLERQITKQQAKADAELSAINNQARRAKRAQQRRADAEAAQRRRTLPPQPQRVVRATPVLPATTAVEAQAGAPVVVPPTVTSTPQQPATSAPAPSSASQPSPTPAPSSRTVELQPVTVPTEAPEEAEEVPPPRPPGAVQIFADHMDVSQERRLAKATGHVRIFFENGSLTADRATLFTDTKDAYAQGRVRLERGTEVFRGELVHYNLTTKKGRFMGGTVSREPWYEHGTVIEHIAENVLRVNTGYVTSCEFEPPHFRFQSRSATVFANEGIVRGRNVTLAVEDFPLLYLPWLSAADRQSPFFFIPGKRKPWEQFVLMGYRYEWPEGQRGTLHLDWRRAFLWGVGIDHQFESEQFGKGLLKLYYNDKRYIRRLEDATPKGAFTNRYRVLWRHRWQPLPDTTVVTDLQKYSDVEFRKEFLFRDEFVKDDNFDSFVSMVTSDPNYTTTLLLRKRLNRFQTITEAYPDLTFSTRSQRIGETNFFTDTSLKFANLQTKTAHSDNDTDVVETSWTQDFTYAWNLFQPFELTPRMSVQQAYYNKDKQGGAERPQGRRDLISGQFSGGMDASLKLFRVFPVVTDLWGLDVHMLRHVLTPTVSYSYTHPPTVPNGNLSFGLAAASGNKLTFGIENKLQTKRRVTASKAAGAARGVGVSPTPVDSKELRSVDLARFLISLPYSFRGQGNKQGGRLGDFKFDLELFPWPWLRLESDWTYLSHLVAGSQDSRVNSWNLDLVMVGGQGDVTAESAPDIQAPKIRIQDQEMGPQLTRGLPLLPQGQWYLGLGHRYSPNDKTESVLQFDWRLSEKWQISTFHRFTFKEVASGAKRFNNLREYQYILTRDLHDWMAELVYRVDREFGEELFFTMTLKAYPQMPIEFSDSYHQPKFGSQSSPFSPLRGQSR